MPEVCRIDHGSLKLWIYYNDHRPPHIHVEYSSVWVKVAIIDGSFMAGKLPGRQRRLVKSWTERRRVDLLAAWERAQRGEHPGKIAE